MSGWLKSLVGYLLIVSVTMQMLPDRKYEQYVKLFTGFLLIVIFLQPVLKIGSAGAFLESKIMEFAQEQEDAEAEIGKEKAEFQKQSEQILQNVMNQIEIRSVEEVEVKLDE